MVRMRPGAVLNTKMRSERNSASSMLWVTNTTVAPGARPDREKILLQLLARLRIERAERLVHEDENGLAHQRARDADALLHAAGQLMRIVLGESGKPDQLDEVARELAALAGADAVDLERELDVAHHGAPGQQAEILEHHAGVLARRRHRRSVDGDAALVGAMRPAVSRSSVVLPQPLGPSSVTSSPLRTVALTRSSATSSSGAPLAGPDRAPERIC